MAKRKSAAPDTPSSLDAQGLSLCRVRRLDALTPDDIERLRELVADAAVLAIERVFVRDASAYECRWFGLPRRVVAVVTLGEFGACLRYAFVQRPADFARMRQPARLSAVWRSPVLAQLTVWRQNLDGAVSPVLRGGRA